MQLTRAFVAGLIASTAVGGVASVVFVKPALAVAVVDGSDRSIQPNDLAKILSIMSTVGTEIQGLRQAAGLGNERYYCGQVRVASGFTPFLVNVIADQKYVLDSSDRDAKAKIDAFGCL